MKSKCKVCLVDFISDKFHPNQKYCSLKCGNVVVNKKRSSAKKEWNSKNKESIRKSQEEWLQRNPEKRKQASEEYRKRNKAYYSNYSSIRSRNVKEACPSWANKEDILDIYLEAEYQGLEVDHIIPIKSKLVCGLHVPSNMQLLTRNANAKKSNSFSLDEDVVAIEE